MKMENKLLSLDTPLFEGIAQQDRRPMLDCITYHTATFSKGEIIAFRAGKYEITLASSFLEPSI